MRGVRGFVAGMLDRAWQPLHFFERVIRRKRRGRPVKNYRALGILPSAQNERQDLFWLSTWDDTAVAAAQPVRADAEAAIAQAKEAVIEAAEVARICCVVRRVYCTDRCCCCT